MVMLFVCVKKPGTLCVFSERNICFLSASDIRKGQSPASSGLLSVGFKARLDQTDHCYQRGSVDIKEPVYFFYMCFFNSFIFDMS